MKKTIVLGASTNETRYSNKAVKALKRNGFEVVPISIKKGAIEGITILNGEPKVKDVHTVTLYMNPIRQEPYYDYIVNDLNPKRIIFNPGTENAELIRLANEQGIETEIACTLVMLSVGNY
jgi:predicted CoA-binding protein